MPRRSLALALAALGSIAPACCEAAAPLERARAPEPALEPAQVPGPVERSDAGPIPRPRLPARAEVGQRIEGTLTPGDQVLPRGCLVDDYLVELRAGMPVTLVLRGGPSTLYANSPLAPQLDMYLILMRHGTELQHDDDSAAADSTDVQGARNSRIVFTPTETGLYVVRATTYGSGFDTGSYTLQLYDGALYDQR